MVDYYRLDDDPTTGCAVEILTSADDEAEMGVYHDRYQPQRSAKLRAALGDYLPFGWGLDLEFVT